MLRGRHWMLAVALLGSTGCFKAAQVNLADGRERMDRERAEEAATATERRPEALRVALATEPALGCVLMKTPDERAADELGSLMCRPFPLPGSATARSVGERADTMGDHEGHGFFLTGFSDLAVDVLKHRLGQRFSGVSTRIVGKVGERAQDEIGVEIDEILYYGGSWQTSGRALRATLGVTLPDGRSLKVAGLGRVESANGQLGWMIPLGIVLFPIGLVPGTVVAANIHFDHVRMAFWHGMDEASKQLAVELEKAAPLTRPQALARGPEPAPFLPKSMSDPEAPPVAPPSFLPKSMSDPDPAAPPVAPPSAPLPQPAVPPAAPGPQPGVPPPAPGPQPAVPPPAPGPPPSPRPEPTAAPGGG